MKMSIAAIALALVYFVSFVTAAHQPMTVSSTPMSSDERMQLAKTIKEMMSNNPKEVDPAVAAMSTEDLFGMLSNLVSNPAVLSNAAGLITAATRGDTGALASHATGLLSAALPAAMSAMAPVTPAGGFAAAAGAAPLAAAPSS